MQVIHPYEGVPVSVVGHLVKIKVEDTGSGESTNCYFVNPDKVDWHMPFAERFRRRRGDGDGSGDHASHSERTPEVHDRQSFALGEFKFPSSRQRLDIAGSGAQRTDWTVPVDALGGSPGHEDRSLQRRAVGGR
jgi:single-stranded DNA-binding protein